MQSINKIRILGKKDIELEIEERLKLIKSKKIKDILESKVVPFSKSGAYIPTTQDYKHHLVYIIVMEKTK